MSDISVKPSLKDARLRIVSCVAVVMLSVDWLNPIKIISSQIGISTAWAITTAVLIFLATIYANAYELIYFAIVVFLKSIISIFYSSVEVLGAQNIPQHGPVIFTGNHMNQFVDGAMVFVTNPHRVRFMVAAKSFKTMIIGGMARATGCIPVIRPQDLAKKGLGKIKLDGFNVTGDGTRFTELKEGDKLRPSKSPGAYAVKKIISDTEIELGFSDSAQSPVTEKQNTWMGYDILHYVDQSEMFEAVHKALSVGHCLGIFPEGGSHDRTDLLPLKAGVAAIAYGALEKYGINVPIIPVGLTYWNGAKTGGDKFRGRAVIEFGQPIRITPEMSQKFRESKRAAYSDLLDTVAEGMRSVIVTAENYEELQLIHTTRRLYRKPAQTVSIGDRQDLSRRLSIAIKILKKKNNGELPSDISQLKIKLEDYQRSLDRWGLKDYQINKLSIPFSKLVYTFVHGFIIFMLASIPSALLNWPVGIAAKIFSERMAKKDLKASRVKLFAKDVKMSHKIVFSLAAVPVLWLTYAILLWFFTSLSAGVVIMIVMCMPVFSYIGVMAVEAGMVDVKDLRPVFLRLLPEFRIFVQELPVRRAELQKAVRKMIQKYGPQFGALYYESKIDLLKYARDKNAEDDVEDVDEDEGMEEEMDDEQIQGDGMNLSKSSSEYSFSTGSISVPNDRLLDGKDPLMKKSD